MEKFRQKNRGAYLTHPLTNNYRTGESPAPRRYRNYVPLDYIRAEIINENNTSLMKNCSVLNFTEPINRDTGEVGKNQKRTARYKNLVFQYYLKSNKIILSGSLHKFWNDGEHNYNDFDFNAFLEVLEQLFQVFGITPKDIHITQLEWAVNIIPSISVNTILDHCLYHQWRRFENKYDSGEGKYIQVEHKSNYLLKFYNKGLHYKLGYDILRIERKQLCWSRYCSRHGIGQTLNDLIESDFIGLSDGLIENWREVLFFDPLMNPEHDSVFKYRDPIQWKKYIEKSRTTRKRHFDKLREYNRLYGNDTQGKIIKKIQIKLREMNRDVVTISESIYRVNPLPHSDTLKSKTCLVTKVDISMQKEESFLLSHTGLYFYLENDYELFKKTKQKYLTKKWWSADTKTQIKEIAHNIRATFTNKQRRERQRFLASEYQFNLFTNTLNNIIITHYGI